MFVLLLLFSFSFALAEFSEDSTVTITSESGEEYFYNNSGLVDSIAPEKTTFQKMFSLTGFASKGPSCGSLGSSKKYAQNQLSCQQKANSCPSGSKNLGATFDCKSCCASGSTSGGSGSKNVPSGQTASVSTGVKNAALRNSACCGVLDQVLKSSGCKVSNLIYASPTESVASTTLLLSQQSASQACGNRVKIINSDCTGLSASLDKDKNFYGVVKGYNVQLSGSYVRGSFKMQGKNSCSYSYK